MDAILHHLNGGQLTAVLIVFLVTVTLLGIVMTALIAPQWRRLRQTEAECRLKQDLAAAGYVADDIEQIVRASAFTPSGRRDAVVNGRRW